MKTKFLSFFAAVLWTMNLLAGMPTNISLYSSEGIIKTLDDDNISIPVTYIAYQWGSYGGNQYCCIRLKSPSAKIYGIASSSDNSSFFKNPESFIYNHYTINGSYDFFDLQAVEKGTWFLTCVQKNAGNWFYYYEQPTPPTPTPSFSKATIYQDCNKNGTSVNWANPSNGHEYVDLGLSVLWATCNVGATNPEDYGNFYAWGETSPKTSYTWENYKYINATNDGLTKYNDQDGKTTLETIDDAASANWGGAWRTPTSEEIRELLDNCSHERSSINGIRGDILSNNEKSIFLPAYGEDNGITNYSGWYWSASLVNKSFPQEAKILSFDMGGWIHLGNNAPLKEGKPIRPVLPKSAAQFIGAEDYTLTLYADGCNTPNTYACAAGQEVQIYAVSKERYKFKQWNDGNKENPRTITINSDKVFMAEYEFDQNAQEITYHVKTSVWSNDMYAWVWNAPDVYVGEFLPMKKSNDWWTITLYIDLNKYPNAGILFVNGNSWGNGQTADLEIKGSECYILDDYVRLVDCPDSLSNISVDNATIYQDCNKNGVNASLVKSANGHEYVDLGLSVLWATCNVGATNPEDYGDYFAWGETSPKSSYTWSNYKYCNGTRSSITKYNSQDGKTTLEPMDDAASVNWGDVWRMPTDNEMTELREKCTWQWTSVNGKVGYIINATNGNSIFLPAAKDNYRTDSEVYGYYQSSIVNTNYWYYIWCVSFDSSHYKRDYGGSRSDGHSIRPVLPKSAAQSTATADYTLTLYADGCNTPNTYACVAGQEVQIYAEPKEHNTFLHWNDGNTDNPRTVIMNSDMAFMAEFAVKQYMISTSATNGTIAGGGLYPYQTKVDLTAIPNEHYHFVQWTDGVKDNPRTITVVGNATYSAIFSIDQFTITTSADHGAVSGAGSYGYGSEVTLTVTPSYGYQFKQWSDGNTDNPRKVKVVADTQYTALFELANFTIFTSATNGTITGGGSYPYQTKVDLTAIPNEHYHFVQWTDGVKNNPRQITVMGDASFSAIFMIDQFTITTSTTNGIATGSGTYEYGTEVTLTVTPDFCYEFIGWSDGNTDNPRKVVVVADALYDSKCELRQVVSGNCGDNLIWSLNLTTGVFTISGYGAMTDYTDASQTPWYSYLNCTDCTGLIVENGITHIGNYAFYGYDGLKAISLPNSVETIGHHAFAECQNLEKVTLGGGLQSIGDYAFYNCIRIEEITCLANRTPDVYTNTFTNVSHYAWVFVQAEYLHKYEVNMYWNVFVLKVIGASSTSTTSSGVTVDPHDDNADVTWPANEDAEGYTLTITKGGEVFCTLTFNARGQLVGLAFAPGIGGPRHMPEAILTTTGYQFKVTGLSAATHYGLGLDVTDDKDRIIKTYESDFTTTGGKTGWQDIRSGINATKYFHNGNLIIERNGIKYTATGQKVK